MLAKFERMRTIRLHCVSVTVCTNRRNAHVSLCVVMIVHSSVVLLLPFRLQRHISILQVYEPHLQCVISSKKCMKCRFIRCLLNLILRSYLTFDLHESETHFFLKNQLIFHINYKIIRKIYYKNLPVPKLSTILIKKRNALQVWSSTWCGIQKNRGEWNCLRECDSSRWRLISMCCSTDNR